VSSSLVIAVSCCGHGPGGGISLTVWHCQQLELEDNGSKF
jgi:hypothetical protein